MFPGTPGPPWKAPKLPGRTPPSALSNTEHAGSSQTPSSLSPVSAVLAEARKTNIATLVEHLSQFYLPYPSSSRFLISTGTLEPPGETPLEDSSSAAQPETQEKEPN